MKTTTVFTLALCCTLLKRACASKILLLPINVNSHINYFTRLGEALRWNNHDVTIAIGSKTIETELLSQSRMRIEYYNMSSEPIFQQPQYPSLIVSSVVNYSFRTKLKLYKMAVEGVENECTSMLSDETFQENVRRRGFDLVITDTYPCFNVQPYKLGVPYMTLTAECSYWSYRLPYLPSYVPFFLSSFSDKMTLSQRIANFLMYLAFAPTMMLLDRDDMVRRYVPEKPALTFSQLSLRSELCLTLRDITVDPAKPRMPNIIEATGLLMVPASPLPPPIEKFVNSSQEGVIVVSFGSWLTHFPQHIIDVLVTSFKRVKQRVIWKYNGPRPERLPSNVMLLPWIPQNDLLAHPNTKLFITHCGISSMVEFVYHGVPVIAAPLFSDQNYNAAITKAKGYGKVIDIGSTTSAELHKLIREIADSDTYRTSVQKASRMLKLEKRDGASRAVFWIEYVLKYGSDHLRSHVYKLQLHEWLMLDVLFIVFLVTALSLCACRFTCRKLSAMAKRSYNRHTLKEKLQ